MPLFHNNPKRRLLAALLIALVATGLCAAIFFVAPARPRHDVLAELKALPVYPNATAPSFDNDAYEPLRKVRLPGPIGSVPASSPPPVEVWSASASITYTTEATPEMVQEFYSDTLHVRGWEGGGVLVPSLPEYLYLRPDSSFGGLEFKVFQVWSPGDPLFELRQIHTARVLTIKTVQQRSANDPDKKLTRVEVRLQIEVFVP
jgi:hypothetical protein